VESACVFISGCTQMVWTKETPALIRNYDHNSKWFEGILLNSNWLQPVMGISDCKWGLLDGMNESGLCASLNFRGRNIVGQGFGIPLVIRYLLETCKNVDEAVKSLDRVPVHMGYNVMLRRVCYTVSWAREKAVIDQKASLHQSPGRY